MSRLSFSLEAKATGSRARAARFKTLHNEVITPTFMPVGTMATVRAQSLQSLESTGAQVLLANTYHLLLRPGPEVFRKLGGIHRFMNWKKSVLTDSGGFQIFCLPNSRRMSEEGAEFRSYVDGKKILLTPELSIDTQKAIGSDIMMVLDQCISSTADHGTALGAMDLTHRWAERSLKARGDSPQSLFGIVQGACFEDLRKLSAEAITSFPFDGFAIGGLAVGEGKAEREDMCALTADLLPENYPRYLMGVGTPIDLLEAVHRGVDMFDCILPTSMAQQGVAYTFQGRFDLKRGVYKFSEAPIDAGCDCYTCANFSRAYLHHLSKAKEYLGWHLIGLHNLWFYQVLMREMREAILEDRFLGYYREKREVLQTQDQENPMNRPRIKPPSAKLPKELGDYAIHASDSGFSSIRHKPSGEIMHSVNDPNEEANRLYIEQSNLAERLQGPGDELVLWDVGLGAAHNAMAAIRLYEKLAEKSDVLRKLRIVSFENDLNSLKLATASAHVFPHLKHAAPYHLLEKKRWQSKSGSVSWELVEGDFTEKFLGAPIPDLIFYDPFSFKTDLELWTLDCFRSIRSFCRGHATELFTYSASTAVRATLLAAGFFVGQGLGTGPKSETTRAFTLPPSVQMLLGPQWLEHWERSGAKIPSHITESLRIDFERHVREHAQFGEA